MRLLAAIALAATAVACSSAPQRYATVFVPESLTDCPGAAAAPRGLPAIVPPATLRSGYDRTEAARAHDHVAASECRRTLHEVISIITDFNEQQRRTH